MNIAALFTNIFGNHSQAHQHTEHHATETNCKEAFESCGNDESSNDQLCSTEVSGCPQQRGNATKEHSYSLGESLGWPRNKFVIAFQPWCYYLGSNSSQWAHGGPSEYARNESVGQGNKYPSASREEKKDAHRNDPASDNACRGLIDGMRERKERFHSLYDMDKSRIKAKCLYNYYRRK